MYSMQQSDRAGHTSLKTSTILRDTYVLLRKIPQADGSVAYTVRLTRQEHTNHMHLDDAMAVWQAAVMVRKVKHLLKAARNENLPPAELESNLRDWSQRLQQLRSSGEDAYAARHATSTSTILEASFDHTTPAVPPAGYGLPPPAPYATFACQQQQQYQHLSHQIARGLPGQMPQSMAAEHPGMPPQHLAQPPVYNAPPNTAHWHGYSGEHAEHGMVLPAAAASLGSSASLDGSSEASFNTWHRRL